MVEDGIRGGLKVTGRDMVGNKESKARDEAREGLERQVKLALVAGACRPPPPKVMHYLREKSCRKHTNSWELIILGFNCLPVSHFFTFIS